MRIPCELCILTKQLSGRFAHDEEDVLSAGDITRVPHASVAGEIELAGRQMEVEPPALAQQPWNRVARAKDAQVVASAIAHNVFRAAAVQRMCSGPKPVNRRASILKEHLVVFRMKSQFLNGAALRMPDADAQWLRLDMNRVFSPRDVSRSRLLICALAVQGSWTLARNQTAVVVVFVDIFVDCRHRDSQYPRRDGDKRQIRSSIAREYGRLRS